MYLASSSEARAPREFRYWANLDTSHVRLARAASRLLFGFDPAPHEDVVRAFASMYYDTDPDADAFIAATGARASGALLERALVEGRPSGAPPTLARLLDDIESEPSFVDWKEIELGARVFRRWRTDVFRFAGALTLAGYRESSVAKPLALSGGYIGAATRRRFLETVAFWVAVSEPKSLLPHGAGWLAAIRVRRMHAVVRARVRAHPDWSLDDWGEPISQADALLTLLGGSVAPFLALQAMGYRPTLAELGATLHFWRYVGHLTGVRPRVYPTSLRDALEIVFLSLLKGAGTAGDDERQLCQSYAQAFAPDPRAPLTRRAREALTHRVHLGYTRFFTPPSTYRRNALPPAGIWAALPLLQFPLRFSAETVRRHSSRFDDLLDRAARRDRDRWLARHWASTPKS